MLALRPVTVWRQVNGGATTGQRGSEDGVIVRDEEHPLGARITLERSGVTAPFAITCGIYGWMVHTRFFGAEPEAALAFEEMKDAVTTILSIIPNTDNSEIESKARRVSEAISAFVDRYP